MGHPSDILAVGFTAIQATLLGFTFETLTSGATGAIIITESVVRVSAQAATDNYVMLPKLDASKSKLHIINNVSAANNLRVRASNSEALTGGNVDGSTHEIGPETTILVIKGGLTPADQAWAYVTLGAY